MQQILQHTTAAALQKKNLPLGSGADHGRFRQRGAQRVAGHETRIGFHQVADDALSGDNANEASPVIDDGHIVLVQGGGLQIFKGDGGQSRRHEIRADQFAHLSFCQHLGVTAVFHYEPQKIPFADAALVNALVVGYRHGGETMSFHQAQGFRYRQIVVEEANVIFEFKKKEYILVHRIPLYVFSLSKRYVRKTTGIWEAHSIIKGFLKEC